MPLSAARALRDRQPSAGPGARRSFTLLAALAVTVTTHAPSKPDPLRLEIVIPTEVQAGDSVPVVLRLVNPTDRPVPAYFLGREIAFDVVVTRENGEAVWRRLAGAVVPSILQVKTLAPGEALELKDSWRAGSPGTYLVHGEIPRDDPQPRRSAIVRLRVIP
jgi:intracellular proteinase inhibitor BsuPI